MSQGDILIAEDSRLLLQLLKDALLAHGLSPAVQACDNGLCLLEVATQTLGRGQLPALYILDIIMPGPSGLDIARQLRQIEAQYQLGQAPILFYSSLERSAIIDETIELTWPARFLQKQGGARPDALALTIVEILKGIGLGSPTS